MFYLLHQYPVIAFATPWWYPVILDSLRSRAVTRAEPLTRTVDGAARGSATAAPTSLTCSHATWETRQDGRPERSDADAEPGGMARTVPVVHLVHQFTLTPRGISGIEGTC